MLDLLLHGARLPGEAETRDIGIKDGLISELEPEARHSVDLGGALVTPALVEPHIHLDAVLTVGEPRHNESGSLFEGIAIWADRVKQLTVDDVKQRVRTVLRWQLANGVQFVRTTAAGSVRRRGGAGGWPGCGQGSGARSSRSRGPFPRRGRCSCTGG